MEPKWLTIGRGEIGEREVSGPKANPRIVEYFAAADSDVTSDETSWCSAFACWCLEKAGYASTNNLAARSWLRYGKKVTPKLGAIMVFKRGTSNWQGHVGFYVGETATKYKILGGNQGNSVSIREIPKSSFLDARWPDTIWNSGTVKAAAGVTTGGAVALVSDIYEIASPAVDTAKEVWPTSTIVGIAAIVIVVIGGIVIFVRRNGKMKSRE